MTEGPASPARLVPAYPAGRPTGPPNPTQTDQHTTSPTQPNKTCQCRVARPRSDEQERVLRAKKFLRIKKNSGKHYGPRRPSFSILVSLLFSSQELRGARNRGSDRVREGSARMTVAIRSLHILLSLASLDPFTTPTPLRLTSPPTSLPVLPKNKQKERKRKKYNNCWIGSISASRPRGRASHNTQYNTIRNPVRPQLAPQSTQHVRCHAKTPAHKNGMGGLFLLFLAAPLSGGDGGCGSMR